MHATLVLLHAVLRPLQGVMPGSQARQQAAAAPQEVERMQPAVASRCAVFVAGCDAGLTSKATVSSSASGGGV